MFVALKLEQGHVFWTYTKVLKSVTSFVEMEARKARLYHQKALVAVAHQMDFQVI
jgi:hypothetical protein